MERHNLFFPEEMIADLKRLSEETGAPMSELIRRAVKEYLDKRKREIRGEK
jgi:metal-responsive CopG/Arc/MetJ family transcriptional regulator